MYPYIAFGGFNTSLVGLIESEFVFEAICKGHTGSPAVFCLLFPPVWWDPSPLCPVKNGWGPLARARCATSEPTQVNAGERTGTSFGCGSLFRYPKWNSGKWTHALKPAVLWWFSFDPSSFSLAEEVRPCLP